ncbi:MAG: PEP-utilizing enzyme [Actinomycetota bacterium]
MSAAWFTDHPPSERFPHYTRANAGEVLPTPVSPLGQTLAFDEAILPGFQQGSIRMGSYEAEDYRDGAPEMCGFFGGHFYINLSCVRMQAVRNPAITVDQLDTAIFGTRDDTPPYEPHPLDEKPHLLPIAEAHQGFVVTATEWPELLEEKDRAASIRAARPDLGSLSDAELLAHIRALIPVMRELTENQMIAAGSSGIAPGMLAGVAEAIGDPTLPMTVLSGLGDVDSAAPSFDLWEMSRFVRDSSELTTAFDGGVDGVLELLTDPQTDDARGFKAAIDGFLYEFGSRGPNEWELSAHTWETDPGLALVAIDRARPQPDEKSPAAGHAAMAAARDAAVEEARAKLADLGDDDLTGMFEAALVGGLMMVYRERAKTTLVRVLHEVRMAVRELGRRHAESGALADADHVFMLTSDELGDFVADPGAQRERLADRAGDWAALWNLEPPFFISDGEIPALDTWPTKGHSGAAVAAVGETLAGVPGSPGTVTGRARLVVDPADPPDLVPGDIMVAPLTDPAWTPLFLAVDGVVVDVGGQISHAVIVSRELGLPCAVSVSNATERIPDGATIELDGSTGEVRLLALP